MYTCKRFIFHILFCISSYRNPNQLAAFTYPLSQTNFQIKLTKINEQSKTDSDDVYLDYSSTLYVYFKG